MRKKIILPPIGVHPFEKIDFKVEKIAILTPFLKSFPGPRKTCFITKREPVNFQKLSKNYEIIGDLG